MKTNEGHKDEMITHTDEKGEKVIMKSGSTQDYIVFFDTESNRLSLKHKSGKFIKLYSEDELNLLHLGCYIKDNIK